MKKKINTTLATILTVWIIISVISIVLGLSTNNDLFKTFGGVLFGSWLVNFIKVLSGGYFYD